MDLDHEIDSVFKKLDQRVTDPDVACAALKQLVRIHFLNWASAPQIGDVYTFIDTLFQTGTTLSSHRKKAILKAHVHKLRTQAAPAPKAAPVLIAPRIEWLP